MSDRKGIFQRVADRLRNRKPNTRNSPDMKLPDMIERGPEQHADDDRMHISGNVDGISRRGDGSTGRDPAGRDIERGGFGGS